MFAFPVPPTVRALHDRLRELVLAGQGDRAPSTLRIPNAHYTDPAIAAAELRTSFGAPLLVTPALAVPEPGDYITMQLVDLPVIVTRDADVRVHVFVNACRHRGANVAEGDGCTRRFTCPYHAWVYDSTGALVGQPGSAGFDDRDPATLGLVELPSEVRHGFVWALRDPNGVLDLDDHLGPLGDELASWGYDYHVGSTLELDLASNWKCALEAFTETYHFPVVHKNSMVGMGSISDIVTSDQFGRHHRLGVPIRTMRDGEPGEPTSEHMTVIYYMYPNSVFAASVLGGELLQFVPGDTPGTCRVRHSALSRIPVEGDVAAFYADYVPKIQAIVRDEDAVVLESSGRGLAAGCTDVILGRNEVGCQAAHRQLLADLERDGIIEDAGAFAN